MSVFTNPSSGSAENAKAYTSAILELLGDKNPIAVLEQTLPLLRKTMAGLTPEEEKKREAPGKWSVRHVVQHLADSELVWSWRLRLVLAEDRPTLTGYDQDLWADRLGYDEADAARSLMEFSFARNANLRLLHRATPQDLKRVGVHSERGDESVAHMMRLYAGHDLLHLNQINRIRAAIS